MKRILVICMVIMIVASNCLVSYATEMENTASVFIDNLNETTSAAMLELEGATEQEREDLSLLVTFELDSSTDSSIIYKSMFGDLLTFDINGGRIDYTTWDLVYPCPRKIDDFSTTELAEYKILEAFYELGVTYFGDKPEDAPSTIEDFFATLSLNPNAQIVLKNCKFAHWQSDEVPGVSFYTIIKR